MLSLRWNLRNLLQWCFILLGISLWKHFTEEFAVCSLSIIGATVILARLLQDRGWWSVQRWSRWGPSYQKNRDCECHQVVIRVGSNCKQTAAEKYREFYLKIKAFFFKIFWFLPIKLFESNLGSVPALILSHYIYKVWSQRLPEAVVAYHSLALECGKNSPFLGSHNRYKRKITIEGVC